MKSVMGLLMGLAMLVPGGCFAAQAAPTGTKAPAGLTAAQILAKVSQTYRGLTSFRFVELQQSRKAGNPALPGYEPSGPFGDRPLRFQTDLSVSTPGKIRLDVDSWVLVKIPATTGAYIPSPKAEARSEIMLVSDGRKAWAYIPSLNEYTEADAAPLVQELWRHPIDYIGDDLARYRSLSHEAGRAKLRGEETLSIEGKSVRCYVVDVPERIGSRKLWVDEQRFIVLRDEWTSPPGSAGSGPDSTVIPDSGVWISRLLKMDLGPASDEVFQFAVPRSAHRVDLFGGPVLLRQSTEELVARLLIGSEMTHRVTTAQYAGTLDEEIYRGAYPWPDPEYALQGTRARDFTLGSLDGANVGLDKLRGKIVVLVFFASWCQPCQEELAAIQKLHDELASRGVVFLGIDSEPQDTVESFVKAHSYAFPVLLDSNGTALHLYGVRLVPTTVVINGKGKIVAHYVGADGEAQLMKALKAAGLDTAKP